MLWLYLHFPLLPLDIYSRSQNACGPIAMTRPHSQDITWLNTEAERAGIRAGMSVNTAFSLLPELTVLAQNETHSQHALQQLAQWAYNYSAQVCLKAPDGLLLEIGSMLRLFGGLPPYWERLQQDLHQQGFHVYLATGHTPLAAQCLAQSGGGPCSQDAEHLQQQLGRLSIQQALFDANVLKHCQRMGLTHLQQLLDLPGAAISQRFGQATRLHLARLSGQQADPQQSYNPPPYFYEEIHFIEEVEQIDPLFFPLQRLLKSLSLFLIQRQLATDQLHVILRHRQKPMHRISIRCSRGEQKSDELSKLCRLKIEAIQLEQPVVSLGLQVKALHPHTPHAADLFRTHANTLTSQQLLSRLQARLGDDAVHSLATVTDHRPERAWRLTEPGAAYQTQAQPHRPLWLLPQPAPVEPQRLAILSGPERISAGWWDEQAVRRDYYIARGQQQELCWVFRRDDGHWFIQGYFG